ncbi:E3 ubiquitin/ISG15 ligase TRIM25 [Oreochromis niloticus]|uniref:E3 ubiquitin/ISG15 ligase TRIM25 n=1 Tax=Oreochromis niloticus TaxID=8128 RepID=UPI000DF476F1|nr:E3 ubiquitin/ISG15 ligase TRIM25 [Oreochromis niloticus]
MAQKGVQLDQETFSCSICLDLLKDLVTTACGHSYCRNCIKSFWDEEDRKGIHSCPQCRKTFTPRPVLDKNTMLADLVEQLKKTGLQAAPADHCYAGPEDVACDVCTGRKLKAIKSCLVCLISYCEKHLQPHYDVVQFKKHKLVAPSKKLQENICSRHDEVMKIFCRTDQQSICYLCTVDEHKGHETVPAAAERTEKQKELEVRRLNIQQRIQEREKDVKLLQQEVEAINGSADKAVEDSEKMFTELIRLIQKRSSDVKQQVRSQQETEVSRVKELQEKLEQEIAELKRKDGELEQLSHTEDHNQFLHNYPSLSALKNLIYRWDHEGRGETWREFHGLGLTVPEGEGELFPDEVEEQRCRQEGRRVSFQTYSGKLRGRAAAASRSVSVMHLVKSTENFTCSSTFVERSSWFVETAARDGGTQEQGENDLQDPAAHHPHLMCLWIICSQCDTDLLSGRGEPQHHTGVDVHHQT